MSTTLRHRSVFEETRRSANIGVPSAQYELGLMYANGVGVVPDLKLAIHWIKRAAEGGMASAQFLLATRYANGIAVPRDELLAARWLMKSYEQGNLKAIWRFGKLLQDSVKPLIVRSLLDAAQSGVPEAQIALGELLLRGELEEARHATAIEGVLTVARGGSATAQCLMGELHANGIGVAQDKALSYDWYRQAARQCHAPAQVALCEMDKEGFGRDLVREGKRSKRPVGKERRRSTKEWRQAAEDGDGDSQYAFGILCEHGWVVAKDEDAALGWYKRAASLGSAQAQVAMARVLERRGEARALELYRQAAERGSVEGAALWGARLWSTGASPATRFEGLAALLLAASKGDHEAMYGVAEAVRAVAPEVANYCVERSAELDNPKALYRLAHGGENRSLDSEVRFGLLMKAAELGLGEAQCALGIAFRKGQGCKPDLTQALFWLNKAAEQNDPKALWTIGSIYAAGGPGVKQDIRQAFVWCKSAAALGFVPAQATLGVLYERVGELEQSVYWLRLAAQSGDAEAQYNLGMMYYKGSGVEANAETAFRWIVCAAEGVLVVAQSRVGVLYMTGDGVAEDPIEAHKWWILASRAGDRDAVANELLSRERQGRMQLEEAVRRAELWGRHGR